MKIVVVASRQPEYLERCLTALLHWSKPKDITVFNNAYEDADYVRVASVTDRFGCDMNAPRGPMSPHNKTSETSPSLFRIHDFLRKFSAENLDEAILKIDEDVIFYHGSAIAVEPGIISIPGVTINNYTSRQYIRYLAPNLEPVIHDNPMMWLTDHASNHPVLAPLRKYADVRRELIRLIYGSDPQDLISLSQNRGFVEYIGAQQWQSRRLMERRGISIMAMAFVGRDYLHLVDGGRGERSGGLVDEELVGDAVRRGDMMYRVDHRIFCHHISYFGLTSLITDEKPLVTRYLDRLTQLAVHD